MLIYCPSFFILRTLSTPQIVVKRLNNRFDGPGRFKALQDWKNPALISFQSLGHRFESGFEGTCIALIHVHIHVYTLVAQ